MNEYNGLEIDGMHTIKYIYQVCSGDIRRPTLSI